MIEAEVLEILADTNVAKGGERFNEIIEQFRAGRNVRELLVLLDSSRAELVSIGAWMLGELPFELYSSDDYTLRLQTLLEHQSPEVRFHALGALFPSFQPEDPATQELLRKLRSDPNEGVRMTAEAATARLSLE